MLGKDITVPCLPMDKLVQGSLIRWLDMEPIKVRSISLSNHNPDLYT